jgi:cytochrome c-type biogenesis protein CcmH
VAVSLSPQLSQQLSGALPLFILARDPSAGGPPLAVQRRSSGDLPLQIELSEKDAMIPTRTIATVPKVVVVARLSRSGAPQAQSGDLYGEAAYEFGKNSGPLTIIIDRTVP